VAVTIKCDDRRIVEVINHPPLTGGVPRFGPVFGDPPWFLTLVTLPGGAILYRRQVELLARAGVDRERVAAGALVVLLDRVECEFPE